MLLHILLKVSTLVNSENNCTHMHCIMFNYLVVFGTEICLTAMSTFVAFGHETLHPASYLDKQICDQLVALVASTDTA